MMNSTAVNTYCKLGFKNHSHLIKVSNVYTGDYLTNIKNEYNKI